MTDEQPVDGRTGAELADAIRAASMDWQPDMVNRCHNLNCSALSARSIRECDCGVPDLLRRLLFALGKIHGMWLTAESDYPADDRTYDDESVRGQARTSTLDDVLRVLAPVIIEPPRERDHD